LPPVRMTAYIAKTSSVALGSADRFLYKIVLHGAHTGALHRSQRVKTIAVLRCRPPSLNLSSLQPLKLRHTGCSAKLNECIAFREEGQRLMLLERRVSLNLFTPVHHKQALDRKQNYRNSQQSKATITVERHLGTMSVMIWVWVRFMRSEVETIEISHFDLDKHPHCR
jgi:hypothetical protein